MPDTSPATKSESCSNTPCRTTASLIVTSRRSLQLFRARSRRSTGFSAASAELYFAPLRALLRPRFHRVRLHRRPSSPNTHIVARDAPAAQHSALGTSGRRSRRGAGGARSQRDGDGAERRRAVTQQRERSSRELGGAVELHARASLRARTSAAGRGARQRISVRRGASALERWRLERSRACEQSEQLSPRRARLGGARRAVAASARAQQELQGAEPSELARRSAKQRLLGISQLLRSRAAPKPGAERAYAAAAITRCERSRRRRAHLEQRARAQRQPLSRRRRPRASLPTCALAAARSRAQRRAMAGRRSARPAHGTRGSTARLGSERGRARRCGARVARVLRGSAPARSAALGAHRAGCQRRRPRRSGRQGEREPFPRRRRGALHERSAARDADPARERSLRVHVGGALREPRATNCRR